MAKMPSTASSVPTVPVLASKHSAAWMLSTSRTPYFCAISRPIGSASRGVGCSEGNPLFAMPVL